MDSSSGYLDAAAEGLSCTVSVAVGCKLAASAVGRASSEAVAAVASSEAAAHQNC